MSGGIVESVIYRRGKVQGDRLTRALIDLAAAGLRPHCSDPETHHLWTSEHRGERAEAALLCLGCPALDPCGTAAEARHERWGVWAGVDRSPRVNDSAAA
jgi:hypothetical protein